jgi:hypothetical protein
MQAFLRKSLKTAAPLRSQYEPGIYGPMYQRLSVSVDMKTINKVVNVT